MTRDELNNLVYDGRAHKTCELTIAKRVIVIYWHTIQNQLIVDDGQNVRTVPDGMENMDEIARWAIGIPNDQIVNFKLRAKVMDTDVEVFPNQEIEHGDLKTVGFMGDYIYGSVEVSN